MSSRAVRRDRHRQRARALAREDQRKQELVVGQQQAEQRGHDEPRPDHRQHDPREGLPVGAPVDPGRLVQFGRHLREQAPHQPDGERLVQRHQRQDHPQVRVVQPERPGQDEEGDGEEDRRHHPHHQEPRQDRAAPPRADPRQRVGRHRPDRHRGAHDPDRDHRAVHQVAEEAFLEPDPVVELEGRREDQLRRDREGVHRLLDRREERPDHRHQAHRGEDGERAEDGRSPLPPRRGVAIKMRRPRAGRASR